MMAVQTSNVEPLPHQADGPPRGELAVAGSHRVDSSRPSAAFKRGRSFSQTPGDDKHAYFSDAENFAFIELLHEIFLDRTWVSEATGERISRLKKTQNVSAAVSVSNCAKMS